MKLFYSFYPFYLFKIAIFLLVAYLPLSITAEVSNKDQSIIRYHIKNGEYQDAKNLIEQLSIVNFNDPQLELFATEILILEAENAYNKKLYKTSYEKFMKANVKWSTHPLVQQRLSELQNIKIVDNTNASFRKLPIDSVTEQPITPDQLQFLHSRISFLEEMILEEKKIYRITTSALLGTFFLGILGTLLLFSRTK
ncbi:hypothetical protein [Leptospira sp. GIMC2001]|uniref:hypothetical protein n=1 Tax=Leptospira sp. GIMC2001 TaxID=1513297 RepID=UPI0023494E10|nr:hypothetical protein [Leptospira sp. GIMC2001]WCL50980.1 hypothetical protein O4O04_09255 [Leptospira sp. GIMC2001]